MYTSIIFDLDGTLLDTLQDLAAAGNHALAALQLPGHPVEAFRFMVGNGIPNLVARMLPEGRRDEATHARALALFQTYYAAHKQDFTAPYPGILPLLETLKNHGVLMGVASNKADDFVQPLVRQMFPGLIAHAAGLKPGAVAKPDPTFVLALAAEMGADPAHTLYVGDSGVDMQTAQNAGFAGCGVLWGFRPREELAEHGAQFFAKTPAELETLILGDLV